MKATLVYWHKARLQGRYVLEMAIHQAKGPHIHVDDEELPYTFVDEARLLKDFRALVETYMGVAI